MKTLISDISEISLPTFSFMEDLQPLYSELHFLILSGDRGNFWFLKKMFSKSSYIYVVFLSKNH